MTDLHVNPAASAEGSALLSLLSPRSVAVLGASDNAVKAGGRPIDYMRRQGFAGAIYPVNPNRATIQGLTAYPSLDALPSAPDLVVISVPGSEVEQAIDQCLAIGARGAVIYSSGFAELGEAGAAQQRRLVERARAGGLRLFGPNTQGLANFSSGAIAHFSTMINEEPGQDGPVAIVSQSGAGSAIVYGGLRRKGIGVRYMVATGNEADVSAAEVVDAVLHDERVRVVLLYIESLRDPQMLAQAARLAHQRDVPILAVKAGRTQAGQLTASSHTGALAGEDALADAFLRRHGIVRVADFRELSEYCQVFIGGQRPRGDGVVAISNSGATCVLAADAAEDEGLRLVEFDAAGTEALRAVLPSYVSARNPIDMTTALLGQPQIFGRTLDAVAARGAADMIHVGFPIGGEGYDFDDFSAQTGRFASASGVPVVVSANQEWVAQAFRKHGVPVFDSERAAMRALGLLSRYVQARAAVLEAPAPQTPASLAASSATITLDEVQSLAQLAAAGLPAVAHRLCRDREQVRRAVAELGLPVVAKGVSASITHKSEYGLVRLGLDSEESTLAAFDALDARLRTLAAEQGVEHGGVLIARQHKGAFELAVGAHRDPVYGPVVMIGQGGVLVEALDDVQFLPAPFSAAQAREAIARLHIARAFGAVRGMPAVDVERLAAMLVALGDWFAGSEAGRAAESVDANPVIVPRGDAAPVIVDAVVVRSAAGEGAKR
ncbi:acetate--CoA ligase family protein [Cupriavidus gilardii]|uniref:acetate--CoA ligase family protein n=1 Tax=Cupriavidus gilardii TaxID=82541 RepID=UPI001ABE6C65|nr:acetate--CoA ligase family protein [Cupriavidus gilardii]MBO4119309.1 acetate--CoA ligase family protein [Cupriavidus gilardii]